MDKRLLVLVCVSALPSQLLAQRDSLAVCTDTLTCYFDQGKFSIDGSHRSHQQFTYQLDSLAALFRRQPHRLDILDFVVGTSPEGASVDNLRLAEARAHALRSSLIARIPPKVFTDSLPLARNRSWEMLADLLRSSTLLYREDALSILAHTPEWVVRGGRVVDSRKRQLMQLRGGVLWRTMQGEMFSRLRLASVVLRYSPVSAVEPDSVAPPQEPIAPSPATEVELSSVSTHERRTLHMALRSNLLYDAVLVPNVGLELDLGKRWSLLGSWAYAWWHTDRKHYYWRLYGGDLELRRYWGKYQGTRLFSGHHMGLYAGLVTYDFELGGRGYLGEHWSYYGGISYGYSLPIGRRLNLDFSLGLGYLGGRYKEYLPEHDCYVWQVTKERSYVGPTKAEISLVWLVDFTRYRSIKRKR